MIIIIGLVILLAAVVVGVAGVLSNGGHAHALSHQFAVFGYHVTGSTGTLFLYGIALGAIGVLGLSLLLAGARRSSRRGHEARRGLKESRRQTASVRQDRDHLLDERETARTSTASTPGGGPADGGRHSGADSGGRRRLRDLFGRRPAAPQATAPPAQAVNSDPGPDVPAGASALAE